LVLTNATALPKTALPSGSVLQVVQSVYRLTASSTSTTFASTGLTASITPTFSTSRILVMVVAAGVGKETSNTWAQLKMQRGSTDIFILNQFIGYNLATTPNFIGNVAGNFLDSPATTSPITYTLLLASANGPTVYINASSGADTSTITLLEIAA